MNAYACLYNAIKAIIGVMAPITPFLTDYVYQNTVREIEKDAPISVHLTAYPEVMDIPEDKAVLESTRIAREIIATAQRMRNEAQIKVKQPLSKMYVTAPEGEYEAVKPLIGVIKEELNVKDVEFTSDTSVYNEVYFTVNFRVAGAALKGEAQKLKALVDGLDALGHAALAKQVASDSVDIGAFSGLKGNLFDAHDRPRKNFVVTTENSRTLALDTELDDELIAEGIVRELIRQIQVMRKDAGFAVEQRIYAEIIPDDDVAGAAIAKYADKIKADILAKELSAIEAPEAEAEFNVQSHNIKVRISRK